MNGGLPPQARSFGAYLWHNALLMLLDLVVVVSWMIVATAALQSLGVVRWAQYVALVAGVVAYALVTPAWEHPGEGAEE